MRSTEHLPAIDELVDHLVEKHFMDDGKRSAAITALREREEQRSTGIGGGIAIPHCFLDEIKEVVAIFGRSTTGIEFCALDCSPVHFVFLFVVPKAQYSLHLKTLAAIARILNSAETRSSLREAKSALEIYDILSQKSA